VTTVEFGISSLDVAALPIYADATGAFAAAGVKARIRRDLGHPAEVVAMVAAGELDIGYADIITSLRAVEHGQPVALIAPGGLYDDSEPIVTLAKAHGSIIETAADLAGRVIVTPSDHDLARLGTRCWLDASGGDSQTVRFASGRKMAHAAVELHSGMADAFIISEPQRTLQASSTEWLASPFDAVAPLFIMGAYVAAADFVKREPAAASALRTVLRRTSDWANSHREESGRLLAERLEFDRAIIQTMSRARYADTFRREWMDPIVAVAVRYGELSR
jgi:NitT/TauT family transport system substrate-binding protein